MLKSIAALVTAAALGAFLPNAALAIQSPEVKLSRSKICHPKGTEGYQQTKNFTPFASLEDCLKEGRLRKDSSQGKGEGQGQGEGRRAQPKGSYDRDAFGGWADFDGNCMNTRHEMLKELSTAEVSLKNRCSVERGRWLDPYTGKVFTKAADVDIDHLVPLAYAWARGADEWAAEKRRRFANDPVNLFAVDRSANRDKGAKGVAEWLPPEEGFRCQYILRFQRVVASYKLQQSAGEVAKIDRARSRYCKG